MKDFVLTMNKVHENIEFFKENSEHSYVKCINQIVDSDPFMGNKFYIFSFIKRVDDSAGIKKMYHHPRLTKPEAVPGGTLIRVDPNKRGDMQVMWTIPNQETFELYRYGKAFADKFIWECITTFRNNPDHLSKPEPDDLTDDQIREVYKSIKNKKMQEKFRENLVNGGKQEIPESASGE